jgi:hypothetical protein
MSSENASTGEPNHSADGEGCKDRAGQSRKDLGPKSLMSDQRAGGVSGGGGSGRDVRLSGETCDGGASSDVSTSGTSAAKPREAGRAVAGVGDLHSSVDLTDIKTVGERREGTCPTALQRGGGSTDGQSPALWIGTKQRSSHLDGMLYRGEKQGDNQPHGRLVLLSSAENEPKEPGLGKPCAGKPPARFDEGEGSVCGLPLRCSLYST